MPGMMQGSRATYRADDLVPGKFLHDFLVIGPFPNPLPAGMKEYFHTRETCPGFYRDYLASGGGEAGIAPYEGQKIFYDKGDTAVWKVISSPEKKVDLKKIFTPNDGVECYAAIWILSNKKQEKLFGIGFNDGIRVWFNGKQQLCIHKPNTVKVDDKYLRLNLQKGSNLLLLKVDQGFGGWGFVLRPVNREIAWEHIRENPDVAMNSEYHVHGKYIEGTVGDKDIVGKISGLPQTEISFRAIDGKDHREMKAPIGTFLKLKKKNFPAREYAITYSFPIGGNIHHSYGYMNTEGDVIRQVRTLLKEELPPMPPSVMADYYRNFLGAVRWLDKTNKLWHHPYGYRRYLDGLKKIHAGAERLSHSKDPLDGIFPVPAMFSRDDRNTTITSVWKVYDPQGEDDFIHTEIRRVWRKRFNTIPQYTGDPGAVHSIRLVLSVADTVLNDEGYSLQLNDSTITVRSVTRRGLYYGINTFLQMLEQSATVAAGMIADAPRYSLRSTLANADKLTPAFRKKIERLARFRYNTVFITSGNYLHLDDPARLKDMREVFDFCRSRFIEPVPYFETFGGGTITRTLGPCFDEGIFHNKEPWKVPANGIIKLTVPRILDCPSSTLHIITGSGKALKKDKDFRILVTVKPCVAILNKAFTGDTLLLSYDAVDFSLFPHPATCPSIPEGWQFEEKIIADVLQNLHPFGLHIGQDEAGYVNMDSRCKARGLTNREIMTDEIQHVHRIIRKYDKKVQIFMWGDMFNDYQNARVIGATGAVDGVPKDIIILDWNYVAVYYSDKIQTLNQLNFYFDRGYRTGGAAWFEPANVLDILLAGEPRGKQFIGVVFTDWAGFAWSFYPVADANWTGTTLLGKITF